MEEHGRNDRIAEARVRKFSGTERRFGSAGTFRGERDLIFDLSKMNGIKVSDLSLMLTAHRVARADERTVWVTGLDRECWVVIRALGLEAYFRPFPYLACEEA